MTLFRDWRNQLSWGRVGAAVALAMAVKLSLDPIPNIALIGIWLGAALGNYGANKVTEMFCGRGGASAISQEETKA